MCQEKAKDAAQSQTYGDPVVDPTLQGHDATVAKMCLSHFICEDGRLTADLSVICWESGHLSYLPITVVGLVSYVLAVSAVWLNVISKNSERVKEDMSLNIRARATNPNCHDFRKRFHHLYDGYQRRYYCWGVVELVAKLALVLNEMVFSFDSALVLMANVLVLFIYFVAHSSCQPFCVDAADKQKEVENYDRELAGLQHVVTARNRIRRKLTQSSALWKSRSAAWLKLFSKCNLVESACLMAVMWLNLGALFVTALKASGRRMLLIVVSSICALVLAVFFFYCFCTIGISRAL